MVSQVPGEYSVPGVELPWAVHRMMAHTRAIMTGQKRSLKGGGLPNTGSLGIISVVVSPRLFPHGNT